MPFLKDSLPQPKYYYAEQLSRFKANGYRATALCPFHNDRNPSFAVNLETGSFKCFSCGAKGGDVLAFHRARYYLGFKQAAEELGAWS